MLEMVDRPVTQTAEADKNSESTQDKLSLDTVVKGSLSKRVPINMIDKKLDRMITSGGIFFLLIMNPPKNKLHKLYTVTFFLANAVYHFET
jgi:hypothetical protein